MLNRRQLITATALAGSTLTIPSVFAAYSPKEGKDFTLVKPALDYPKRPIVVHDFFAYTCPHCLQFAPTMEAWMETLKSQTDVQVVPVPVAWTEDYSIFSRTYFSLQALNRLSDLHMPFWNWVIREEHEWTNVQELEADIAKWISTNGKIDQAKWNSLVKSFSIVGKYRQATQLWKMYGVESTPCVGIAGRYITAPHLAGTRQGAVDTANFLIDQIRQEK